MKARSTASTTRTAPSAMIAAAHALARERTLEFLTNHIG